MEFYATLGDPCARRDILDKLFRAGMTGIRVNLSHTSLDKCAPLLEGLGISCALLTGGMPARARRAVLAGLESGNLADVTPYSQNSRTTFRGRLLAFVRRNGQGEIVVKIAMEEGGACISRTLHGA